MTDGMRRPWSGGVRNNGVMTPQRRIPAPVIDLAVVALILVSTALLGPRPSGDPGPQGGPPAPDMPGDRGGFSGLTGIEDPDRFWFIVPVAAVLAAAVILLRRRWPVPVFATTLVIYTSTVVLELPVIGAGIAVIVAAWSVATRHTRTITLMVGIIGTGVVALLSLIYSGELTLDPQVFQVAAGIAIAAALGDSTRSRREYTAAMTERAERAEQTREAEARRQVAEERLRIAQDLHDTVAHRISVISLNAGVASAAVEINPDKARESLGTIRTASREVLSEIGVLLRYLRAEDGETAASMPQPGTGEIGALVRTVRDSGMSVTYDPATDLGRVDELTGRVLYRVVQEGLTNAGKHGSGHTVTLKIDVLPGAVTVAVSNPVSDTDRNQPDAPHGGLGLTGLRERVAAAGGTVRTGTDDSVFRLDAELPLR
jgi:signal transduction histidine kinase